MVARAAAQMSLPIPPAAVAPTLAERLKSASAAPPRLGLPPKHKYAGRLSGNPRLTRALVSFQANKNARLYRWMNYREAFSSDLVEYCLDLIKPAGGAGARVLDPFAGAGTTLTTARRRGWRATGIELMPVGIAAIQARLIADTVSLPLLEREIERLKRSRFEARAADGGYEFPHLRITKDAFPRDTEKAIGGYLSFADEIEDADVQFLFRFACQCVLEEVSYTRKDGQYLRWDSRSGRVLRSHFNKGLVSEFRDAVTRKLEVISHDLPMRGIDSGGRLPVEVIEGSCLQELPSLADDAFDLVMTSPPYCNRYDYTRTYALELAFFGYGEEAVKQLRQALLSATVENRSKRRELEAQYTSRGALPRFRRSVDAFTCQGELQEALAHLRSMKIAGRLNNNNIPNLVENYFLEMSLVVHELARVLAPGGHVIMVNDNVRYHGHEVPVDFILGDFAESAGLKVEHIWVLPRGKGNSSQQMGEFGRAELRKCVYVWSKPA